MVNESNKIIVKVGKKSEVKFSHSKVFRAITANELASLVIKYDDCHIIVIESIDEDEQESVKLFIENFKAKDSSNEVLFFIPNNDDITSGIADELEYNIYLTLNDLYTVIYDKFGINVSISLDDKKKYNVATESIPEGMVDIFGGLDEDEEKQLTDELSHADEVTDDTDDLFGTDNIENITEDSSEESIVEEIESQIEEEINDTTEETSDDSNVDNSEAITKLKIQLRDAKYDLSVAVKDMKAANSRIESLEEIIRALKDEKDTLIARFNELVETDNVIEDPIPLAQYNRLNEIIDENDTKIKELSATIESLKELLASKNADIEDKTQQIDDLRRSIDDLSTKLDKINKSIESGEIHKDVIEEYTEKVDKITEEKDKALSQIETIQSHSDTLQSKIDELQVLVSTEASVRQITLDKLTLAIDKMIEFRDKLVASETELEELKKRFNELCSENESNKSLMVELKEKADTADKRVELANSYADEEKRKLEDKLSEVTTKLTITEQQLAQKESQYTQLVATSGVDGSSAAMLVETNKTLENMTKTLREQLGAATRENESLKKKNVEANTAVNSLKNQCQQLTNTLKDMATIGGGSGAAASVVGASALMKDIVYNGRASLIPVFGSGSYGITTTAQSIMQKLGTNTKVLYLDFDLVSAKADAWFGKIPLCKKVPGINVNDRRMTGLGIFYERGIQDFINNYDNIVNMIERNRTGAIDYVSGIYYRVDNVKVTTADYSTLLNYLGSMYDYIIIDLGRLGSSDINDRLIKLITDAAGKSVAVTTSDIFDVRSFRARLQENNIIIANIAWLLNMCNSTSIEDKIKQLITPAQFGLMITDTSMYGSREKFTRNKVNKDKLELFLNSALFSGRR